MTTLNMSFNKSNIDEWTFLLEHITKLEDIELLQLINSDQKTLKLTQQNIFNGDYLIHYAIANGKNKVGKNLVSIIPDVNLKNDDGNTPLAYACIHGNLEMTKELYKKGA